MESENKSYELEQSDKTYILTLSIQGDSIEISCNDKNNEESSFKGIFSLEYFKKLDSAFEKIDTLLDALNWIDSALKDQKVHVLEEDSLFKIVFHMTTNEKSYQMEISLKSEEKGSEKVNTDAIKETETELNQEIKPSLNNEVAVNEDSAIEIGLDPSKIERQSLNEDTNQIIQSIEDEKRKSLSKLEYKNIDINTPLQLNEETLNINIETPIDANNYQEINPEIQENNNDYYPEIATNSTTNYVTNFTNINEQNNNVQYSEIPDLTAQYITPENNIINQDFGIQTNIQEYSSYPEATSENLQNYQISNTYDNSQFPIVSSPLNADNNIGFTPYVNNSTDYYGETNQYTTNITNLENFDQGYTQGNYGEFQTNINETQFDAQNLINNEYNITDNQNYVSPQYQNNDNFLTQGLQNNEIAYSENYIKESELNLYNENNNNLNYQKKEIELNPKSMTAHEYEKRMLLTRIKELERITAKYKQDIKILKEIKLRKEEKIKEEKKQALLKEKAKKYIVEGDIIHSPDELELITKKINKIDQKITLNLLYKATVDSDKAEAFHEKCDKAKCSLVLVETDKGKRFGGFTTSSWSGDCVDKKDEDAFVFSLDKMKVYENIPDENAIGCYPKYGPIFLGCQIRINDRAFKKGGTTFEKGLNFNTQEDYELTGGDQKFNVKEIEVYEVIVQ